MQGDTASIGNTREGGRAPRMSRSRFMTAEERYARKHRTFLPYFRTSDSLCRGFLMMAADPLEFAGLKSLFPFVREMSLLRALRSRERISEWMPLAFMAGHDLGRACPELVEEILPGLEFGEAWRRVGALQHWSGQCVLNLGGLKMACTNIVQAQWPKVAADELEPLLLETVVKCLRTGFAAGSFCQTDPVYCEFVGNIPPRSGTGMGDLLSRFTILAPLYAAGKPATTLLEHPLIRMVRAFYAEQPSRCAMMLSFFRERLRALKVESENDCPCSELDLLDWITAAVRHGVTFARQHPALMRRIRRETARGKLACVGVELPRVLARAGGMEPAGLLVPLKQWQKERYGKGEPAYYGEQLERVVYFCHLCALAPCVVDNVSPAA